MDAKKRYETWLTEPNIDTVTKNELREIANNAEEINDRFFQYLTFGTGGMRGKIGAGANRMNVYTIRLATQALANVLIKEERGKAGIVIAYDSRRMSREFCQESANVLVANGIPVYVFERVTPTPILSFAVRHLKADGGIVITASHNPPEYNGYKVYQDEGVQLLPDDASKVSSEMNQISLADVKVHPNARDSELWKTVSDETYQAYYETLKSLFPPTDSQDRSLNILYTPLHGTGGEFVPRVLTDAGFTNVSLVPEQSQPDGEFPTVKLPNPEEADSFRLAFAHAGDGDVELIMATDPDGDRVGVAVRTEERYVLLSGNQIGVLLTDYLLQQEADPRNAVVITTIVSTDMVDAIVAKYGATLKKTLTGFKYIGEQISNLEGTPGKFLFGFEESYGYLSGTYARDKDAVLASLLIAQMAAEYKAQEKTLVDRLFELMNEHGYYLEDLRSYAFETSAEAEKAKAFIEKLRDEAIPSIGGEDVVIMRDYGKQVERDLARGEKRDLDLPQEEVIQWVTEQGTKISLRPSGTEPKMKLYMGVRASTQDEAEWRLRAIEKGFDKLVSEGLKD